MRKLKLGKVRLTRRGIGIIQNVVIVALLISTVLLLGGRAGFGLGDGMNAVYTAWDDTAGGQSYAGAEPMCVVVTPGAGVHSAAMYDSRTLDEYYSLYSAALAEALGSAGEPVEVTDAEWRAALTGTGVHFDYYTPCQLSSYAVWLGSDMTSSAAGHSARRVCLALDGDEVALYYIRDKNYMVYRCSTGLGSSELAERINGHVPNGAQFVFELDEELPDVDQYSVVLETMPEIRSLSADNSLREHSSESLMSAFGMNSNLARGYLETDGTEVYLEGSTTLRLGADGLLRYTRRDVGTPEINLSPTDAVNLAMGILDGTVGLESGMAELRLSYSAFDAETQEYTLRFEYAVNGLPVSIRGRSCAAEFHISGNSVTEADILFRSYAYTGGSESPLPARLAVALEQARDGGETRLSYIDTFSSVYANWITV